MHLLIASLTVISECDPSMQLIVLPMAHISGINMSCGYRLEDKSLNCNEGCDINERRVFKGIWLCLFYRMDYNITAPSLGYIATLYSPKFDDFA